MASNYKVASSGDIIGFYGDETTSFSVGICLDYNRAVIIGALSIPGGVRGDLIRQIIKCIKEKGSIETLKLDDEISLEKLSNDKYEIYNINVLVTPASLEKSIDEYFDTLRSIMITMQSLDEGDIIKMQGLKFFDKYTVYHHHAIFSDKKRAKIIHKFGEPDAVQIIRNFLGQDLEAVTVSEHNLLEIAVLREVNKENCYDTKFKEKIRSKSEIVAAAKKRVGEKGYNVMTNNCQHFCTDCRYGVPIAIEVENTKTAVTVGAIAVGLIGAVCYAVNRGRENKKQNEQQKQDEEKANKEKMNV